MDTFFTTTGKTAVSVFRRAKSRVMSQLEGIPDWRLHDFRRTMVTIMNDKLGVLPHVIEAVVNHISGPAKSGAAGVYNKAQYLEERREASQNGTTMLSPSLPDRYRYHLK